MPILRDQKYLISQTQLEEYKRLKKEFERNRLFRTNEILVIMKTAAKTMDLNTDIVPKGITKRKKSMVASAFLEILCRMLTEAQAKTVNINEID